MNREELVKTLELLKPALSKDNLVPVCQCFCFKGGKVMAYDNTLAICGPEPDPVLQHCIHGNSLIGLLSASSVDDVSCVVNKGTLELTLGKAKAKLPASPAEEFLLELPDHATFNKIPFTESTYQAMQLCLQTVSKDETQKALQGIYLVGPAMYSSNSDMLTRVQIKPVKKTMMLPTAFCEAISRLWANLKMTKGTIGSNGEWLWASFEDWDAYHRVPELNQELDFAKLVEGKVGKEPVDFHPIPKGLYQALSRARVLADIESSKTDVTIAKGKLHLSTKTHMGDVEDVIAFKDHADITFKTNAVHLQQALGQCEEIAFYEDFVVLQGQPDLFMLVSNL